MLLKNDTKFLNNKKDMIKYKMAKLYHVLDKPSYLSIYFFIYTILYIYIYIYIYIDR